MADRYEMVLDLVDNASNAIDQVKDKLLDLAQNASGTTKALGIAGLAVGAAAALGVTALNSISEAAKVAITNINAIGDASARLGMTVKDVQVLTGTFRTFGITTEQTYDSLIDFTEKIEDARDGSGSMFESLKKLNIQLANTDGSLKSNTQLFDEWFRSVINLGDASERVWHGAQISDGMRDIVAQGHNVADMYDTNKERVEALVKVTELHVQAAKAARTEAEIYAQTLEQNKNVADVALGPLGRWWDQVGIKTNDALTAAKLYFQEFAQNNLGATKGSPAEQLIAMQTKLAIEQRSLAQYGDDQGAEGSLLRKWRDNVKVMETQIEDLLKLYPQLRKAMETPAAPGVSTGKAQNADQSKAQKTYLDKLQKTAEDARVRAIADFKAQTEAEVALTNQRLEDEATDTIKTNKITGAAVDDIWKQVHAAQASNSIAAQNKIAEYQKKQNEQSSQRSRAVQNVIDGIQNQTKQLEAQKETLTSNSRELEYQLELHKALESAKAANNNKDLDAVTIEKIKSGLLEKQAAARELEAAQQSKNFNESIDTIKQQTESLGAITQEQKDQVEIKQAIIDKEKEYKRALTDTEKTTLTNTIIDKQKAQATADLAQKNADEIKQIYANAAESIQGAFSDFFFDAMQGNLSDLADSFKKTIDRMVADLLAANLFKLVGGIGTGVAGESNLSGFFASIFGGIGGRAKGGPVTAGTPYWVGEQGPEIVVPGINSTVIPANESAALANGSGNASSQPLSHYSISIQALDSKSFMDMIERDDRTIVTKLAEASSRYNLRG